MKKVVLILVIFLNVLLILGIAGLIWGRFYLSDQESTLYATGTVLVESAEDSVAGTATLQEQLTATRQFFAEGTRSAEATATQDYHLEATALQSAELALLEVEETVKTHMQAADESPSEANVSALIDYVVQADFQRESMGSGVFHHDTENDLIEVYCSDYERYNLIVYVKVYPANLPEEGYWDYALVTRDSDGGFLLFGFFSTEEWVSFFRTEGEADSSSFHSGYLSDVDFEDETAIEVVYLVLEDTAHVYVNGDYLAKLDISASEGQAGSVCLAIGLPSDIEQDGGLSTFENFTIWTLPSDFFVDGA